MIARIRIAFVVLLAVVTLAALYRFADAGTLAALHEWRNRWPTLLFCLLLNVFGITLDFICWRWMYRRCGIRVRGFTGVAIFISVLAAQLLPMQAGRLVRPDAAQRLGYGSLRNGIEAESALLYLDLAGVASLMALASMWLLFPWAAPFACVAVLLAALASARVASRLLGKRLAALRPELFWSAQGLITAGLRMVDRSLMGLSLFLLIRPHLPEVAYPNALLNVLVADTLGVASGMPAGLGVAEPVLLGLLALAELPEAHIVIAVILFRIVTSWAMMPVAWAALLYVEFIKPPAPVDPAAPTP